MKKISEYRDYDELLKELKKKYGVAKYPYFINNMTYTMEIRNKRGKEGLYIHHDKEDKYPQLSVKDVNIEHSYPFECHFPENLTYANALEHLMLHILISLKNNKNTIDEVGVRGIMIYMVPQINTYLAGSYQYKKEWLRKAMSIFDDEETKEEYFKCLEYFVQNYRGIRSFDEKFIQNLLSPDLFVLNDDKKYSVYFEYAFGRLSKVFKK